MKNCYICLPIAGKEDTVLERLERASYKVKEMGYNPVTPIDINEIDPKMLHNPGRPVAKFMGNDIETLIGYCEAIYICDGWENSKGCNVEVECAKQYGKEIYYEVASHKSDFWNVVRIKNNELVKRILNASKTHGSDSEKCIRYSEDLKEFQKFIRKFFDYNYKRYE